MKIIITSVCLSFMLLCSAISSKAATYYVIDGVEFKLTPATLNLAQYNWVLGTVAATAGQVSASGIYTNTINLSSPLVAETKTLSLSVLETLSGCLSLPVENTIIVLPKTLTALVTSANNFCSGQPISALLTMTTEAVTGLPAGISVITEWTKDGAPFTLPADKIVTAAGVYVAKTSYVLPGGALVNPTQLLASLSQATVTIVGGIALPGVPALSIL